MAVPDLQIEGEHYVSGVVRRLAWLRMRRADVLIVSAVFFAVLMVWILLVGFDAFLQFARQLSYLGRNGYTLGEAAYYILLSIPRRFIEMFGHAALIGTLLGLGGLAASNELTALRAAGMSRLRIGAAALALIAVLSGLVMLDAEYVMPPAEVRAQGIQLTLRAHHIAAISSTGLWARDGHYVVNVRSILSTAGGQESGVRLRDVRVYGFDSQGRLLSVFRAKSGSYQNAHWQLDHVQITRFDKRGAQTRYVAVLPWKTILSPRLLELSVLDPNAQSLGDLLRNIHYLRGNGQNARIYSDALWRRLLYPLNVLLLVLCTLPLVFGTMRSGGFGKRLLFGLLIAIGWFFLQRAMVNLAAVYGVPAWLANTLPLLLLVAAAVWLFRRRVASG